MAMISCPECGKQISDKAVSCPNCGYSVKEAKKCEECGAVLPQGAKSCPQCGLPIGNDGVISASDTAVKKKGGKKAVIIIAAVMLIVLAGAFVVFKFVLGRNDNSNPQDEAVQSFSDNVSADETIWVTGESADGFVKDGFLDNLFGRPGWVYSGDWQNGLPNGYGIVKNHVSDSIYTFAGNWINGKKDGEFVVICAPESAEEQHGLNRDRFYIAKLYYSNGVCQEDFLDRIEIPIHIDLSTKSIRPLCVYYDIGTVTAMYDFQGVAYNDERWYVALLGDTGRITYSKYENGEETIWFDSSETELINREGENGYNYYYGEIGDDGSRKFGYNYWVNYDDNGKLLEDYSCGNWQHNQLNGSGINTQKYNSGIWEIKVGDFSDNMITSGTMVELSETKVGEPLDFWVRTGEYQDGNLQNGVLLKIDPTTGECNYVNFVKNGEYTEYDV